MPIKNQLSTNTGLTTQPEFTQSKDPEIWQDLLAIRYAIKGLQESLDLYTGALSEDVQYWGNTTPASSIRTQYISRVYLKTSEAISFGQIVNFWNNAGVCTVQKANATDATKPARGYCVVVAGVASGAYGEFNVFGDNSLYTGLTPAATYYLSTTAGQLTVTAPSTSGNIVQPVGYAFDTKNLYFNPSLTWTVVP